MIFTPTFILLLGGGVVGILLGAFYPPLYIIIPVGNLILVGAALLDYFRFIDPRRLKVERDCQKVIFSGEEQKVTIRIQNLQPWPVSLLIKDSPPYQFEQAGKGRRLQLLPNSLKRISYRVTPYRRGEFKFGSLFIRLEGRWHLTQRQISYPLPFTVKVYPSHKNLKLFDLALHRAALHEYGLKITRTRGEGTEFRGLREYVPGDDYRRIDWKATARRARPMVREYQADRNQRVMILLDCGRLMSSRIGRLGKLDYAVNAALLVAHAALWKGDQVGLLSFSNQVRMYIPMGKGRAQLSRINEMLNSAAPDFYESDYHKAFLFLGQKLRRRALLIIFTDVVDEEASHILLMHLMSLIPRHLPLCVTISDPGVREEKEMIPRKIDQVFRKAAAIEYLKMYDVLYQKLEDQGALVVNVPADRLSLAVVNKYLEVKAKVLL